MPDHLHHLLRTDGLDVNPFANVWKSWTTTAAWKGYRGALWQPGMWDRTIRDAADFDTTVDYIVATPAPPACGGAATGYGRGGSGTIDRVGLEPPVRILSVAACGDGWQRRAMSEHPAATEGRDPRILGLSAQVSDFRVELALHSKAGGLAQICRTRSCKRRPMRGERCNEHPGVSVGGACREGGRDVSAVCADVYGRCSRCPSVWLG
jgi:hypothetical protein